MERTALVAARWLHHRLRAACRALALGAVSLVGGLLWAGEPGAVAHDGAERVTTSVAPVAPIARTIEPLAPVPESAASALEVLPVDGVCADSQVWILSTRGLACGDYDSLVHRLGVSRRDACGTWSQSSLADFLAANDAGVSTCFFIHGNRAEACEDPRMATLAYQALTRCAPGRPLRVVFWSWPSDKIPRHPLQDARAKMARTDIDAHYLARVLAAHSDHGPVALVGFSFGARVATGALHLSGGGAVQGNMLPPSAFHAHGAYRAMLLAAALDNDAFLPGHLHDRALSQVDQMLIVTNCCDTALRRYHLIFGRRSGVEALGATGPLNLARLGSDSAKLACFDACPWVGKQHDEPPYLESAAISRQAAAVLFPAPVE